MRTGAVAAEAVRSSDGLRLRAHVGRGAEPDVGRGGAGLLPVDDAEPQGCALARHDLPQHLRLVRRRGKVFVETVWLAFVTAGRQGGPWRAMVMRHPLGVNEDVVVSGRTRANDGDACPR